MQIDCDIVYNNPVDRALLPAALWPVSVTAIYIYRGVSLMKKFGKFLTFLLLAGGAAAATWYFLKSQEDDADFEDYDDDINDELDDFLKKEAANADRADREYTPLDFPDAENQTESTKEEAVRVIGETKDNAADAAGVIKDADEKNFTEFKFETLKNDTAKAEAAKS